MLLYVTLANPLIARPPEQHDLVLRGVEHIIAGEIHDLGGQLGSRSGARLRTYERLRYISESRKNALFPPPPELNKVIDEIYHYPLQEMAKDTLNRQLRSEISDDDLIDLVVRLRDENRLCHIQEQVEQQEPQIICSLGLFEQAESHQRVEM